MARAGDTFEFAFESVDRTFRYRVAAGAAASPEYTVTALHAPRVRRIDLRYEYPPFTGLQAREETDGGDVYTPEGTRVRVRVHTDKPVRSGALSLGGAPQAQLEPAGDRQLEGTLVLSKDDSYRVALRDTDDLQSAGDTEYFIRIMDDRPPDVRILRPGGDQQITPLEEVAIEARADDDHGIARFELVYAVAGREPKVVPLNATGTDAAKTATHLLAAEDLGVQPGDVISYYARARDVARGRRSTETRSDMFFLEVRPFSEEFVSAQSQAMAGMAGDQIDTLIAAQKEIINATWNIERRAAAGAGRSSNDITSIADAQAELKGRAEQIASRGARSRGGFRLPRQIGPMRQPAAGRQGGDPVSAAISAMGRAVDQLHGQRTGDALTHEMAALRGLLQAQAEIRRREVSQQSGAGAGGLGRQGQDLSALFDKELQRQQRTNYETRSQLETSPDRGSNDSALDRIRDLARRQEELSRQQRELANASLPPDEVKRRLETLTREQIELRERAEEIARQMAQQGAQPGSQAKPGEARADQQAAGEASGGIRGASEQMRNAATELQRRIRQRSRTCRARGGSTPQARRAAPKRQPGRPSARGRRAAARGAAGRRRAAAYRGRSRTAGQGHERSRRLASSRRRQGAARRSRRRSAARRRAALGNESRHRSGFSAPADVARGARAERAAYRGPDA